MKKALRVAGRIGLALVVILAGLLFLSLDSIDYRPWFRSDYYRDTESRLRSATGTVSVVTGPLQAGFGKTVFTPTIKATRDNPAAGEFVSLPLAGYGQRNGAPATGTHDDLLIKAVAIRVENRLGVLVGADALIIPPEVAELAAKQLAADGLGREQLYFSASHTHASIGGWGEGVVAKMFAGDFNPGARTWFAECLVKAVRAAIADLKPASWARGGFAAAESIRNRLIPGGAADPEFSFFAFKQDAGPTALVGSFSAHATVLSARVMDFSADYPGAWQRAVERETGGMAVFIAGAVGSQSPVATGGGFDGAEDLGRGLARKCALSLAGLAFTNRVTFGCVGLDLTLPPLHARVTDSIRLRPWVTRKLLSVKDHAFVQAFRVNDAIWISTPCDYSAELALDDKEFLRARGFHATLTSFNGDYIGYIIPARYYHLDGYEPRVMSFFGPNAADYLNDMIRSLAVGLVRAN